MYKMFKRISLAVLAVGFLAQFAWADTELRFSWWGGDSRHKPLLEVIKLFEAANPGVKIKGEYMGFGGYTERLTTQISAGSEPDIMQINWAWISTMYSKNGDGFYDLNKSKNLIKLDEWPKDLLAQCYQNGKLNALPASFTARVFLWQSGPFKKAGIPLPKTWDDLFNVGKVFETKLGKDYYPIDGQLYDVILMAHAYLMQKTGKQWIDPKEAKVGITKAEALDFVKFYKKLSDTRAVVPLKVRLSLSGPEAPTEQQQEWVQGKWAGNYTWDSTFAVRLGSLTPESKAAMDVGDFLTLKGAKSTGLFGRTTQLYAVSKHSKNPETAVKFINFMLTSAQAGLVLNDTLGTLITKTPYDALVKAGKVNALSKKGFGQIMKAKVDAPSPWFEHAKIQELVRSIFEGVSLGKSTDEEAVNRLVDETNQVLRNISK